MPVKLSDLANQTMTALVPTAFGDLLVTFRPHALTPADNARLAAKRGAESFAELLTQVQKYIVKWDLEGPVFDGEGNVVVADGQPVPVDREVMRYMSSQLIGEIFTAIQETARGKSQKQQNDSEITFSGSFA